VAAVEAQGLSIRDLKKAKAPKGDITAAVAALLELKAKYQEVTGEPFPAPAKAAAPSKAAAPAAAGKEGAKKISVGPRLPLAEFVTISCTGAFIELEAPPGAGKGGKKQGGKSMAPCFEPLQSLDAPHKRATLLLALIRLNRTNEIGDAVQYILSVLNGACSLDNAAAEAPVLEPNHLAYVGLVLDAPTAKAALCAKAAQSLLAMADGVAALSCEAVQTCKTPFAEEYSDICRPHRGQMTASANLRALLEGSRMVTSAPKKPLKQFDAIPQYHGTALESIQTVVKSLETEINSAPKDSTSVSAFDPQLLVSALVGLQTSLRALLQGSASRLLALQGSSEEAGARQCQIPQTVDEASEMVSATVNELQTALMNEAGESLAVIKKLEEASAKSEVVVAEAESSRDPGAALKPEDDPALKGKTPEQIAKVLAKRKEKEDKAAAKKKKKGGAAGGGGIALGGGTASIRKYLQAASDLAVVMNPFDTSFVGMEHFMNELVTQLSASGGVGGRRRPKVAKGARDFLPEQMRVREKAFAIIKRVFKRHGAQEIDTPVFEQKSTLCGKYGEDSKLIYDLADQGGELLALRYDLTVPFARFLSSNPVGNIKRYHIARVYRRDQPAMNRGRFREFYQCDFDVAGNYGSMIADAEVVTVACDILRDLDLGEFKVKLNHRVLLDAILEICGCPADKFRTICSAIDKLDKEPWSEVRREMVEDKGLAAAVADKIGTFVVHTSNPGEARLLHQKLTAEKTFGNHPGAAKAMQELDLLFQYTDSFGSYANISFDLTLARGLDYYTGLIYELVFIDANQVGSVAAGGRYDKLVGMFNSEDIPCVGVSIGIERVFALMEAKEKAKNTKSNNVEVLVATIGNDMLCQRMAVCSELWRSDISAEIVQQENPKLVKQLNHADQNGIPFVVIFGAAELAEGMVNIKDLVRHTEDKVPHADLAEELVKRGKNTPATLLARLVFSNYVGDCQVASWCTRRRPMVPLHPSLLLRPPPFRPTRSTSRGTRTVQLCPTGPLSNKLYLCRRMTFSADGTGWCADDDVSGAHGDGGGNSEV
jgi:histidyl-tRNA synthetase